MERVAAAILKAPQLGHTHPQETILDNLKYHIKILPPTLGLEAGTLAKAGTHRQVLIQVKDILTKVAIRGVIQHKVVIQLRGATPVKVVTLLKVVIRDKVVTQHKVTTQGAVVTQDKVVTQHKEATQGVQVLTPTGTLDRQEETPTQVEALIQDIQSEEEQVPTLTSMVAEQ